MSTAKPKAEIRFQRLAEVNIRLPLQCTSVARTFLPADHPWWVLGYAVTEALFASQEKLKLLLAIASAPEEATRGSGALLVGVGGEERTRLPSSSQGF